MAKSLSSSNQQFSAVMRVRDFRAYALFALGLYLVFILLAFVANGFELKLDTEDFIVLAVISIVASLFAWFGMWVIFGLLNIPPAKTGISSKGLRVQNAFGFSSELAWDEITAVKTVSLPIFSQLVYLPAGNRQVYCMGRQYRHRERFLDVLDRYAPADHPVRKFFL